MSACSSHYPDSICDGCGRCAGLAADCDGIDGDGDGYVVAVAGYGDGDGGVVAVDGEVVAVPAIW